MVVGMLAGSILAGGCGGDARRGASDTAHELDAAIERYSGFIHAMAADSIASMYAPNGEMLGDGMHAIQGPDSIRTFLASFTNVKVDSETMIREAITVGDGEADVWGTYTQVATVSGHPPVHVSGRFVTQWVRRPGEPWKIRRMLTQPAPVDR
jgi:ketosteroid isomerase-like protein